MLMDIVLCWTLTYKVEVKSFDDCIKNYEVELRSWMLWSTLIFGGLQGRIGFFLGGVAFLSCSTSTPINHIVFFFFFCRIPVVLENRRSSQGEVRTPCTLPLDLPLDWYAFGYSTINRDSKFIFRGKHMYREQFWSVNLNVDGQSLMLNSH